MRKLILAMAGTFVLVTPARLLGVGAGNGGRASLREAPVPLLP